MGWQGYRALKCNFIHKNFVHNGVNNKERRLLLLGSGQCDGAKAVALDCIIIMYIVDVS